MRAKILVFSSLFIFASAFGKGLLGTIDNVTSLYEIYGKGKAVTYDVNTILQIINEIKFSYSNRPAESFNDLPSHIKNIYSIPENYSLSTSSYNAAKNGMLVIKVHNVTKDECKYLHKIFMASYNEQKDERLKPLVNDGKDNNSCKLVNTFTVKTY